MVVSEVSNVQGEYEDIFQIHIPADGELDVLCSYRTSLDPRDVTTDAKERLIGLTIGDGIEYDHDEPFTLLGLNNGQAVVIPERPVAIAYYLHALETHGVSEDRAFYELEEFIDEYISWLNQFTQRTRKLRLLDLAEWRRDTDPVADRYLTEPSCVWRQTGLDDSAASLAEDIKRQTDVRYKLCYWTAQNAAIKFKDNHRVSYVEGLALPKQAAQCVRHAWLEVDNRVVELTWPWHHIDGHEAVYFGTEVPIDYVERVRDERDVNGAVLMDEDEMQRIFEEGR